MPARRLGRAARTARGRRPPPSPARPGPATHRSGRRRPPRSSPRVRRRAQRPRARLHSPGRRRRRSPPPARHSRSAPPPRYSPGAANKLVSQAFPPPPSRREANQKRRLCDGWSAEPVVQPAVGEGGGRPGRAGTARGRGGERKKTLTRFLKGQASARPRGRSLGTKTRRCSRAFRRRELCRLQMPLLYRVCGTTLLLGQVLGKPFCFILGLFQCLGFSAATKPY